jgi:hypothetical protein
MSKVADAVINDELKRETQGDKYMTIQRIALSIFSAAALAIIGSSIAAAQTTDVLRVQYFLNENAVRGTANDPSIFILNPGTNATANSTATGEPTPNICADIYVLNSDEEVESCCGCVITPDELVSETIGKLESKTVNVKTVPSNGVIMIISSALTAGVCDPTAPVPTPDLRAWIVKTVTVNGVTEPVTDNFSDASLSTTATTGEEALLSGACKAFGYSSGHGVCPCPTEVFTPPGS